MNENRKPVEQQPSEAFRLIWFFSSTSLIGIIVVTTCLIWTYHELAVRHLIEHESRANANLTRAFANTVWERYRGFVLDPAERSLKDLQADPVVALIRSEVLVKLRDLPVVKINIYNLDGITVFSTDKSQIGEDQSNNNGFREAKSGTVNSQITYREKFNAFEGTLKKRNLISSYVPIKAAGNEFPEGVFEVYSDVTNLLEQQGKAQWQIAGIVLALLGMLYLFLFLIVRKADRKIAQQEILRAAKEEEIRHLAYHDSLTGLPNRANFTERLEESLALTTQYDHTGTLLFIDLDHFKEINDHLGHHAGDLLLKEVATRIRSSLRTGDLLFRIGGDEFTVILPPVPIPEDANLVAQRVIEAVSAPLTIQEKNVKTGATIGLANFPDDGKTAESILQSADAAMYSAKESNRGTYAFYSETVNRRSAQL